MIRATTNAGGKAQDTESLGGQDTSVATPQSPSGGTQKDRMMQLDDDRRTIPAPSIPNHPIPTIQLQPNRSDQPANNDSKSTTPKTDEPAKSGRDSTDVMTVARASRDGTDEKKRINTPMLESFESTADGLPAAKTNAGPPSFVVVFVVVAVVPVVTVVGRLCLLLTECRVDTREHQQTHKQTNKPSTDTKWSSPESRSK